MRATLILVALVVAATARADLAEIGDDGWYSWEVNNAASPLVVVRVLDGRLHDIYLSDIHCWLNPVKRATHLGTVSANENFAWFRAQLGASGEKKRAREAALLGIARSGNSEAIAYIDALIHDG